ncbi:penicillin-binding transpeptidase domain-containing protein [Virgibacillus halodenitrificans]|uniref:penicillin-binding transpeptidase domain-containing protein n=1 Tax=Virgibacillus halodenitrificans TaxID=1482 RepID=UPI001369F199|nr:penicillin-binding transpeptidase domain-containing protein [Virgibacillus halodenitrificans]MCG1026820.1 penicillin-binding transpeptidase domain-containing protein [Virgibacillus halodenitrificans]MYL44698.1 penicillin-binding transpeptidase domain-containing protein [Virgibacillus halodenitrificans]
MKKVILLFSMLLILFLISCSNDEVTPNERFETYVKQWNKQKFEDMYDMLSTKTKETYSPENFIDRYDKIYGDLNISDLKIEMDKLDEEKLDTAMDEGKATIPFKVTMQSIAGPITFDYEAKLVQEEKEEQKDWFLQWDPGFIFPAMKDGGEVNLHTTAPQRGEILDRNQMQLAINAPVYEIGVIPEKMGQDSDKAKKELAGLLGMSVEEIDKALNANWVEPDLFVPLTKIPTTKEDLLDNLFQVNGVTNKEVTGRVYPAGKATAHLVGYVGKVTAEDLEEVEPGTYGPNDVIGKRGLEQLYEKQLRGEQGAQITITKDGEEETLLAEKPVKNGENVTVTIDVNVQEKIYKSFDGDAGTATAINPKTGETLALVSSPSFDPNDMLYGTSDSMWKDLQEDEKKPLLNRFSATFAPGSVIKPITGAIGLNNGTIKPGEGIKIEGLDWSNGKGWGDYQVHRVSESNGPVDLTDALVRSDNIFFAMKAVEMGSEAYVKGLKQFGLSEKMPYEYPIAASTISSNGKLEDEVLLANSSYGQGELEMSSLHLATAYTTFLNGGSMLKPTLLTSEDKGQFWKKDLITKDQANHIQEALRKVVEKGTASKYAKNAEFPVSGKTGTAELKLTNEGGGEENGWFVGYPTETPDILIAMMVQQTQDRGGSGYTTKKVIEALNDIK